MRGQCTLVMMVVSGRLQVILELMLVVLKAVILGYVLKVKTTGLQMNSKYKALFFFGLSLLMAHGAISGAKHGTLHMADNH